jgi:parvulin-like peptidyl-prolyl isomerase
MTLSVNGVPVPEAAIQFELDRLVKFYSTHMSAARIREQMDVLRSRAREQAIGARLLIEQAGRLDIVVPAEDVEGRFSEMAARAGGPEKLKALLAQQGLTEADVRRSIEGGRRVDMLVDRIAEGVEDPTEEQIQEHFLQHAKEYERSERALVRHILLRPASGTEADRATARSRLEEIRRRIEDGADFSDEAAAHSECPSGRKTGGSLGWFARGMMVPAFDEAVFSMEVGALSEVVETPLGLHLTQKLGAEEAGPAEFADVREKIREFLRHAKRGEVIATYVRELRSRAVIEES